MSDQDSRFADIAAVADAVLFEGYLLYPYRASAGKNQVRWQWGVLVPQGYGLDSGETSTNRTECLVELRGPGAQLHVRVRYLHLEQRTVLDPDGRPVDGLDVGDVRHVPFDEGLPRTSTPRSTGPDCGPARSCRSGSPAVRPCRSTRAAGWCAPAGRWPPPRPCWPPSCPARTTC